MKFNVQRVLTPAYLTSVALVVIGVLLGLAWYHVAAWVFVLLGLALNAMAVSVTEIHDAPRAGGRGRPSLPGRTHRPADGRGGDPDDGLLRDATGDPDAEGLADRSERAPRPELVEPEAETAATPTVPHTGSQALRRPR